MKNIIISIGICVLAISCDYKKVDGASPIVNSVTSGEKFYIPLPENHKTGYLWQMSNTYNTKTLDYFGSVFHGNEKGVYFNFLAGEKGKTTIDFLLIKYRDTLDFKQFIIEVK